MNRQDRGKSKAYKPSSLAELRLFAPLIGLWGVLLGGGVVAVLPSALVDTALERTLLATLPFPSQPLLAGLVAVLLGTVLFMAAVALHIRARERAGGPTVAELAVRRVQPLNPVRDLGTQSLDDPIEDMPFASPAWRDAEPDNGAPSFEPAGGPQELDLASFGELADHGAVPVEAPPVAPSPEPETQPLPAQAVAEPAAPVLQAVPSAPPAPLPGTAALARLRALPPSELSLVEMVERFAGALHEHRAAPPGSALGPTELAAREAALAEALKALAALSANGAAGAQALREEPLRDALARLQRQRGVA